MATEDEELSRLLNSCLDKYSGRMKLAADHISANPISDVVDERGHQYVDIVMEGGGMLGLGLVGYLHVLEQAGVRFLSIAGASAGAITASLLAASDVPASGTRAFKLFEILTTVDLFSFVDGKDAKDEDARKFVKALTNKNPKGIGSLKLFGVSLNLIYASFNIKDNLKEIMGVNRGDVFEQWIIDQLNTLGVGSVKALRARMQAGIDNCRVVTAQGGKRLLTDAQKDISIILIASDISSDRRVKLPEDNFLYWGEGDDCVHPGELVRASMSIPGFFAPKKVPLSKDIAAVRAWKQRFGAAGVQALRDNDHAYLVDGGLLSNFPIDVFHRRDRMPSRPTFGIKIEQDPPYTPINNIRDVFSASLDAARHALDNAFIEENPDYRELVRSIDTIGLDWLNFNMSPEEKVLLIESGIKAGLDFLSEGDRTFDWPYYKTLRRKTVELEKLEKQKAVSRKLEVQTD